MIGPGLHKARLIGLGLLSLALISFNPDIAGAEPNIEVVQSIVVPVPRPVYRRTAPIFAQPIVTAEAMPLPIQRNSARTSNPAKTVEKKPWDALPPAKEAVVKLDVPKSKCDRIAVPYKAAYAKFSSKANSYWSKVRAKRSSRRAKRKKGGISRVDYVLSHPPVYGGPKKPACLIALEKAKQKKRPKRKRKGLPDAPDYLRALKREYGHKPRVVSEKTYKEIYARESLALGLTADQVIGVYALETGGIGPYARVSGIFPVDYKCRKIKQRGRAASTAMGYAQLLSANSNAVLKSHGIAFAKRLEFQALMEQGARKKKLRAKAKLLRRIRADIASGILRYPRRNNWREFISYGKTSKGHAAHAMNLDPDVGPMMQVQKLRKIVSVAERKGFNPVSAAELELMNLVGYGRGLEMMTRVARGVPTSNFFNRKGYYRNPVSRNLTAQGLLDKIGRIIIKRRKNCGAIEFEKVFRDVANKGNTRR